MFKNWLIQKLYYILEGLNEFENFSILDVDLYYEIIDNCKEVFGECKYDFIELYKVKPFLQENQLTTDLIDKYYFQYNELRNKKGNESLKIIGKQGKKPYRYNSLNTEDKTIYDNYYHLNNIYYKIFFIDRLKEHKNIEKIFDKTIYNYIDVHHNDEIKHITDKRGKHLPNLSDMNIVLNKDYFQYQKQNVLTRMDMFVHTFEHMIEFYHKKYVSKEGLKLFRAIHSLVEHYENGYCFLESKFNNTVKAYFTDFIQYKYMMKNYDYDTLKLFSEVLHKLVEKQRN